MQAPSAVDEHGAELLSPGVQATGEMAFVVVAFGAAMGALRAAAFAITYVRIDSVRPGALALLLAVDGFAALSLVPSVKYLPALGREDIISQRTGLYLLMVGLSAVLLIGAVTLGAASPDGWGSWCYGPPSRWFSRGSRTGCSMPRPIGIYGCKPDGPLRRHARADDRQSSSVVSAARISGSPLGFARVGAHHAVERAVTYG